MITKHTHMATEYVHIATFRYNKFHNLSS